MRRIQRWAASAAVVAVGVTGLAGCQPEGAFFAEVRTDGVQVSNRWEPLSGDFDGDGDGDVLWTAVDRPDQLWRSHGDGTFAKTVAPQDIGAEYHAVIGDFGGNVADDILFYAGAYPAYSEESTLWIMGGAGGGVAEEITAELPMYADRVLPVLVPDRTSRDGIALPLRFGDLVVWDADDVHGGTTVAMPYDERWGSAVEPLAGDFDGDGNGDIFIRSIDAPEQVAWSDGAGGFATTVTRDVTTIYHDVLVLELDHDNRADIAFVGDAIEGPIPPVNVWFGATNRTFNRRTLPGFGHRGRVEVHHDAAGTSADALVRYDDTKVTALRVDADGTARLTPSNPVDLGPWNQSDRIIGDFLRGGHEDVLVYQRGGGTEHLLLSGQG